MQLFSRFFGCFFFGTKMVFSINCYMVFPLEHKIEHAGSMLSYAIIDSCSTWQMLAIFWEAVEGFGKKLGSLVSYIVSMHFFMLIRSLRFQKKSAEKSRKKHASGWSFPAFPHWRRHDLHIFFLHSTSEETLAWVQPELRQVGFAMICQI